MPIIVGAYALFVIDLIIAFIPDARSCRTRTGNQIWWVHVDVLDGSYDRGNHGFREFVAAWEIIH